jgi:hypothetical protein
MALGDGIRRNFAKITQVERDRFVAAVKKMHDTLQFSDGVSFFAKLEEAHEFGHGSGAPHDPAVFLLWHRQLLHTMETLLRAADPDLSLHYWDWREDPRAASDGSGGTINLMLPSQMGDDGHLGINQNAHPNTGGGDVGNPFANFETEPISNDPNADPNDNPDTKLRTTDFPGHSVIWRNTAAGAPPGVPSDATIIAPADYPTFVPGTTPAHANVHDWFGGTLQIEHLAAFDPFFFLFHSNYDRLLALWQLQAGHPERLDGSTIFGAWLTDPTHQAMLTTPMVPWDGSVSLVPWVAGNTEPSGGVDSFTAQDPQVVTPPCYETNPPQITVVNPSNLIDFNDVPAGETAMRAAVFDCVVCKETINFSISAGPTGPYGVLIGNAPVNPKGAHQTARIWLSFTGTTQGTNAPNGSVTIHCDKTNQDFVFTIQGNTIKRETVAVELVLDQSGSMDWDAGTSGTKRIDVLKSAAGVFADVIQGGNAAGLVRFDSVAYGPNDAPPPPLAPGLAMTPIGSNDPNDGGRQALQTAINNHATNPNGNTSIGAGVELGRNELNAVPGPPTGFQNKAMIVFTDGLNNTNPTIGDAMNSGAIDGATFAIGLGDATQVDLAALTQLTNNTGGFVQLTDTLTPDTSDFFLVKKYFLQILAGVQNNQIVVDPVGKILPGQVISLPFELSDADIQATTILLTDIPALRMRLRTPAGDMIDPTLATSLGAQYTVGQNLVFYRYLLPLAVGAGAQSGTWRAVLEMDPAIVKRCKEDQYYGIFETAAIVQHPSVCQGVRYSVQVHAWSNLRMTARILQTSFAPGATLTVRAVLTEYNMPVDHRAAVSATVTRPDDTQFTLPLKEIEPGVFEANTGAAIPGIYKFLVHASGKTLRGVSFTREQYLTAAVLYGGDNPLPTSDGGADPGKLLCCLLESLLHYPGFIRYLEERKINVGSLLRCLEECCAADKVYEPGKRATIAGASSTASLANLTRMIASDEKLRSALADIVHSSASPR